MHADEVAIDEQLVRRLVGDQLPQWADLPLSRVESYGTDHAIYRLGEEMAVRLPRIGWATHQIDLERAWLPRLQGLPVAVPEQRATGRPAADYPYAWSVVTWLPGRRATDVDRGDARLVDDLVAFLLALRALPDGEAPAREPQQRGGLLAAHDAGVRRALDQLGDRVDGAALRTAWARAVEAEQPDTSVLSHGDVLPGNLLRDHGRLSGVIDWGALGRADPALDLIAAWNVFDAQRRERLRAALEVDDDTWERSRGWALEQAAVALPYYWDTNPGMVRQASYALEQVISPSSRPW